MDNLELRLECLKSAIQVAGAEALDRSMRAPDTERVAELAEKFYDLVSKVVDPEKPASEATSHDLPLVQGTKKPKADKDRIFD